MARLVLPNGKGHGFRRDTSDPVNDRFFTKHFAIPRKFPDVIALKPEALSDALDQGEQGSCTGHGLADALNWSYKAKKGVDIDLSPAYAYLGAREIEASVKEDSGAEIRDVVKAAARKGVALRKYAPYSDDHLYTHATKAADANAQAHQVKFGYYKCLTIDEILAAMMKEMPIIDGFSWFSCLSTPELEATGVMPVPKAGDVLQGGHCTWTCYADTRERMFVKKNSYGPKFGAKHPITGKGGYLVMPFAYVEMKLATDAWAILHE